MYRPSLYARKLCVILWEADRSCRDKEYLETITPEVVFYVKGTLITAGKEEEVEDGDDEVEESK